MKRRLIFPCLLVLTVRAFAAAPALGSGPTALECIDASERAITHRKAGRLREARVALVACAAEGCPGEVREECAKQLEAVTAAIPTVVFEAKDGAGNDLASVAVTMDGVEVAGKLDGAALELDPGEHTFTFTTEGQPPLTRTFVLRQGEKDRREPIVVGPAPVPAPAPEPAPAPASVPAPASAPAAVAPAPPFWTTGRIAGAAAAGAGVVGVAVGSVLGLVALAKSSDEKSECPGATCAEPAHGLAVSDHASASSAATASTIAFAAGAAALVAGVTLWLTAPRRGGPEVVASAGASGAGLAIVGAF